MSNLLALVVIIFFPVPSIITICSQPSSSLEFDLDVPIDNSMICDSNVDLGYEDNVFDMLGGMLLNFFPYITLVGMMSSLIHIPYT